MVSVEASAPPADGVPRGTKRASSSVEAPVVGVEARRGKQSSVQEIEEEGGDADTEGAEGAEQREEGAVQAVVEEAEEKAVEAKEGSTGLAPQPAAQTKESGGAEADSDTEESNPRPSRIQNMS